MLFEDFLKLARMPWENEGLFRHRFKWQHWSFQAIVSQFLKSFLLSSQVHLKVKPLNCYSLINTWITNSNYSDSCFTAYNSGFGMSLMHTLSLSNLKTKQSQCALVVFHYTCFETLELLVSCTKFMTPFYSVQLYSFSGLALGNLFAGIKMGMQAIK